MMNVLAIIPARGGSKGLPKKNIKPLGDKPLIAWSIDAAKESKKITKTIVSSDSDEIIKIAKQFGAEIPFKRPDDLASDTASTKDVLIHALNFYKSKNIYFDFLVLLQPTSPFRDSKMIDEMIDEMIEKDVDMVVSVKETSANPYYVLFEENNKGFLTKSKNANFTRRQDCPTVYEYNGSVYVIKIESLLKYNSLSFPKTIKYVMDNYHSVDIDNQFDFDFAEFLLNRR